MTSEKQTQSRAVTLAQFEEVFADFLAGHVSLAHLRQTLLDVMDNDLDALPKIQEQIDTAMYSGRLPEQTWENLTAEIDHSVSENMPTEWSDDATITRDKDELPQLTPTGDGPVLFDEDLSEPPVLLEVVPTQRSKAPSAKLAGNAPPQPSTPPAAQKAGTPQTQANSAAKAAASGTAASAAPEAESLAPGTVLNDRFVIVSRAALGSMGAVYKALDQQRKEAGANDPWVAIKLISAAFSRHPAAIESLQNEARNGQRLAHPNVARTFDVHRDGEHHFISMEWLDGESLAQLLDRKRPHAVPREQALKIVEALAMGLAHAHDSGIVHADIKPANVFLAQSGEVKLLDFGIARAADDAQPGHQLQARTPAYASCEVLDGDPATPADDLYSLAALAYRLLAGKRAFGSATALEAEAQGREAAAVPGLEPHQWQALQSALAFRRADRTPDIGSFLAGFFGGEEIVLETPESLMPDADAAPAKTPPPPSDPVLEAPAPAPAETPGPTAESDLPDEDDAPTGASWIKPALAAGIVGVAVAAGWLIMKSNPDQPAPEAGAAVASAQDNARPADASFDARPASAEATSLAPGGGATGLAAAGEDNPAEEPARFLSAPDDVLPATSRPGASVARVGSPPAIDSDPAAQAAVGETPDSAAELAPDAREEGDAPAGLAAANPARGNDTRAETPVPGKNSTPATAEPSAKLAARPDPAPARAASREIAATNSAANTAPANKTAAVAAPVAAAAAATQARAVASGSPGRTTKAPTPTRSTTPAPAASTASAEKPTSAPAQPPQKKTGAAAEPRETATATAAPERDTVDIPPEPVLASNLSLAMVSPEPKAVGPVPDAEVGPKPARTPSPGPAEYGPPPELAPPRIETVTLSDLEFRNFVEPDFPRRASQRGLVGWVEIQFDVTAAGETTEIVILNAEPEGIFENAARNAVERWRFKPRLVNGEPMASRSQVRLRFD